MYAAGSQLAPRLSALLADYILLPEIFSDTYFSERFSQTQSHSAAGKIRSIKDQLLYRNSKVGTFWHIVPTIILSIDAVSSHCGQCC